MIGPSDKLTDDERIELLRGLMSEFATMKVPLARSKKPMVIFADGTFDQKYWDDAFKTQGPAARAGEQIQLTKVTFEGDRLLFDVNGGISNGSHWYDKIQVSGGMAGPTQSQIDNANRGATPTLGTYILLVFRKPMENLTSAQVKKMLSPVMSFDQRSATELYSDTLSPEMKKAIADKRVAVGMTREEVKLILGLSDHHGRETTKDGVETEWMQFGSPPGKITFVTFAGSKVIAVKDQYAGLGGDVQN